MRFSGVWRQIYGRKPLCHRGFSDNSLRNLTGIVIGGKWASFDLDLVMWLQRPSEKSELRLIDYKIENDDLAASRGAGRSWRVFLHR